MKKLTRFMSYVLVAVIASLATMVLCTGQGSEPALQLKPSKLEEVQQLIDSRYIGDVDMTELEDAAAEAMVLATGDRWSYYVPADQYAALMDQKKNSYVGIGVTISSAAEEEGFRVLSVTKGSPAEEAGILAGDLLTHAEGQSVVELGLDGAGNVIRGEPGTFVEVTLLRDGESMTLSVERRQIMTPVVTSTMLAENIGYIQIVNFNQRSDTETIAAAQALTEQGAKALIFDVRNNPGGYKDLLVNVLDFLLPEGPLFRSEDYSGKVLVDESDAEFLDIPMAVLVNGNSYSAAEFFAAALMEYDAAIIVGEQTTGKGHFQVTYELSDHSAVNLSIGRYTTPNDVNLDGVGITPDIVVPVDEDTAAQIYAGSLLPEEDPQIHAAVEALLGAN